ncbi:MAG TPA: zf-HC2 domain-containing protein [Polyangiaceae bacterium]
MTKDRCPSPADLVSFADADLSPEQLQRIEKHLELCGDCAEQVISLTELTCDVAAPVPRPALDLADHVASVMKRLDAAPASLRQPRWPAWAAALVASAAGVALLVAATRTPPEGQPSQELAARGAHEPASLSRDVGVQLYQQQQRALSLLGAGSRIGSRAALTAGLRNLASERAYLLLFAVDSKQEVHWIAPEFTSAGSDPQAATVAPSKQEQLLPSAVVFDELSPGPLRVVAVISHAPLHVSDIEATPASQLATEQLMRRFPRAEVRQFLLEVAAEPQP